MILQPGDRVGGRFQVEALLGEGGTARVYRVRHLSLGSQHALKLLDPEARVSPERLLLEGRIQATLRHPCVVPVTDVVDQDGAPGLIMEFVPGPSLADVLARRRLTTEEALALYARVLAGVGAAHAAGVLHRDLKPHNVLMAPMTGGWMPKVADFGIARPVTNTGDSRRTRVGVGIGTPGYMAPEQARGVANVDRRVDVYALGVMLFELVTGDLPGPDEPGAPPADPEAARARLGPGPLADTVGRALQPDPAERFADVRAFAAALYVGRPDLLAIAVGEASPGPVVIEGESTEGLAEPVNSIGRSNSGASPTMAPMTMAPLTTAVEPLARTVPPPTTTAEPRRGAGIPWTPVLLAGALGVLLVGIGVGVLAAWVRGEEDGAPAPVVAVAAPPVEAPPATGPTVSASSPVVDAGPVGTTTAPTVASAPTAGSLSTGTRAAPESAAPGAPAGSSQGTSAAQPSGAATSDTPTAAATSAPPEGATAREVPASTTPASAVSSVSPSVGSALSTPAPEAAAPPDVRGTWQGTVGGRAAEVRVTSQSGTRVSAQVTLTVGATDRTFRYAGTVDATGALTLSEEGGAGRLAATAAGGRLVGTLATGSGKPLALTVTRQ